MKKKILFLIHDLGQGGAEKVLVNLVNNMDPEQFDITVTDLFGGGVNAQFLAPHVRRKTWFPWEFRGNSRVMKLLSPKQLHRLAVREHYDIEVAYLEGPASRVISGCTDPNTKTVCWIHCTMKSEAAFAVGFRNAEEARRCYSGFNLGVFVSQGVLDAFCGHCSMERMLVRYNTNETAQMQEKAKESLPDDIFRSDNVNLVGVGKLERVKGFDRLIRIHSRLRREGYHVRTHILGAGEQEQDLRRQIRAEGMEDSFVFLGYQTNPYKYVSKCDLFVCSSHSEGFSTAATEALIVGTPVCTVEVSGMKEMLGETNEWGLVTENDEDALYAGIKRLLDDPELLRHYAEQAAIRGRDFSTEETVRAVEEMLLSL